MKAVAIETKMLTESYQAIKLSKLRRIIIIQKIGWLHVVIIIIVRVVKVLSLVEVKVVLIVLEADGVVCSAQISTHNHISIIN